MEPTYQVEDNSNQDHFKYNSEPQMPTLNTHSEQLKDQSDENTDTKITADLSNKRIETNSEDSGSNINNEESETKNTSANEDGFAPEYTSISNTELITPSENIELNESEYEDEDEEQNVSVHDTQSNSNEAMVNSQMEFLQNNTDLLDSPDFLSANLTTKIYLINQALSKNDS